MPEAFDGETIARQRIAEEAKRRTGFLDLGGLGLTSLPRELFELHQLRTLNLGVGIMREDGTWHAVDRPWERNEVAAELDNLRRLPELRALSVAAISIADPTPLAGLTALQSLGCSGTQIADLTPLAGLTALRSLDCSKCTLNDLPEQVCNLTSLQTLVLFECRVRTMPAEVLSQNYGDNCLDAVRAHFRDLAAGADAATDVKLIVLGNGRVGKTQICRRLRGEDYDETQPSTHGILVTSATLDTGNPEPTRLNIWDFGGQDLYHGTHALFLRTSAVFLLVWARETEDAKEHTHQGIIFRNQPLPYWLAYVRHLAAKDSPVLLVQTRCDLAICQRLAEPVDQSQCGISWPCLFDGAQPRKRGGR